MKKQRLSILALVAILGIATYASDRTDAEMKAIASQQLLGAMSRNASLVNKNLTQELKNDYLSVYSAEGRGFVVVSRDDVFPAVLGKSSSVIDMNNLPKGFSWWLQEASNSMQRRLETGNWYVRTRTGVTVEPFLTTKWDQGTPYNLLCPSVASEHCPTGCGATAIAQIMKYYQYPAQGQGTGSYSKNGVPKTKEIKGVYDWSNMSDTYAKTQTTLTTTTEAVATLMSDVGAAIGMDYTISYGGSRLSNCARALVDNFQYDSLSLRILYRTLYTDMEWQGLVYNELTNKRPILYAGNPEDGSSGHAFVFHGLDADGKVYVNWGWSGSCDGYYDMNILQPGSEAAQKGDYSSYNQMLIGFNPSKTPAEGAVDYSSWYTDSICILSIDQDYLMLTARGIYNRNYRSFRGKIFIAMENSNGKEDDNVNILIYDTEDEDGSPVEPNYGFVFNTEDHEQLGTVECINLRDNTVKPGTYLVTFVTQGIHEAEPSPIRQIGGLICQYKLVKGANGELSITESPASTPITAITSPTAKQVGTRTFYDLNGRRVGNNLDILGKGIYIKDGKKVMK